MSGCSCKKEPRSHTRSLAEGDAKGKEVFSFKGKLRAIGGKLIKNPLDPVVLLRKKLSRDENLKSLLETSLAAAKEVADEQLDDDLRNALCWPLDVDSYCNYLEEYAKWTPQQSGNPAFKSKDNPDEYQEPYIRLCHFYFLIDQPISDDEDTVIAQNDPWFRWWLVLFAEYWGSYLDTPESFDNTVLDSFRTYAPLYRVEDSMVMEGGRLVPNNPSGWQTFNQFFARSLNGGLRQIEYPCSNFYVTSVADCTFMETYSIDASSNVVSGGETVRAKGTHNIGNINDLLKDSPYKDSFANGTFVHYFLNTFSYHRFHAPVNGTLLECRTIHGLVYLDVKIKDGQFDAPDSAEDGYEFYQSRGITVFDTTDSQFGNVGLVAAIPVGMAQVSSSFMTGTTGKNFLKGDEFGYFQFGGSDYILLFQEGVVEQLLAISQTDYLHYGTSVAKCGAPKISS